jgi:hypothetical protein
MEPPPLELPESSPADAVSVDTDKGRTLIRYNTEITAEEFSSSPGAEREMYLSQSCPNWGTFQMPTTTVNFLPEKAKEEATPGAMAVPGNMAVESSLEAEGIIGKSPTILETFKLYNAGIEEVETGRLDDISEEPLPMEQPEDDDDDDGQFALDL